MHDEVRKKIDRLLDQAQPRKKDPPPKTKKTSILAPTLLLVAVAILIFQTITITAAPNPATASSQITYYKIELPGQPPQLINYPTNDFKMVGCAHFKTKPVEAEKDLRTIKLLKSVDENDRIH